MRAVIIVGGSMDNVEFYKRLITPYDAVICADSGLDRALAMGVTPQIVIGDMDSVKSSVPHQVNVMSYPTNKDKTDTRLAIDYALKAGFKDIMLLCALGGRFDHAFANVYQLMNINERGAKGVIVDERNEIHFLAGSGSVTIEGEKGNKLSLIPLTEEVDGVTTFGLKYALYESKLWLGSDRGISNEFLDKEAGVLIKSGKLLVIKSTD